ncbi:MAG: hypothetical protein MUF54_23435, partial [Polyangiaceae bacterium]|nr:hypothetical protein [Polyangiaceae bacterium]
VGVGFPTLGPQVWTSTSCLLVMPVAHVDFGQQAGLRPLRFAFLFLVPKFSPVWVFQVQRDVSS